MMKNLMPNASLFWQPDGTSRNMTTARLRPRFFIDNNSWLIIAKRFIVEKENQVVVRRP